MSLFSWLCGRKPRQPIVEEFDPKQPATGPLSMVELLREQTFERYTLRRAMGQRFESYSSNVQELMEWIDWMQESIEKRDYAPDKWKQIKLSLTTKALDDYMSIDGHDLKPSEFAQHYFSRIYACSTFLAQKTTSKEEEAFQRYYCRVFRPILHDCFIVLRELHQVCVK